MIEVFIPHKLPTLNEYIQIERGNRYAAAKKKKTFTELCSQYFTEDIPTPCEVECIWNFKNFNSDPDNIAFGLKFILDGAVKSGHLKNDNLKNIQGLKHDYKKSSEDGVQIYFKEI